MWGIGALGVFIVGSREFQFDWRCSGILDVWDVGFRRVWESSGLYALHPLRIGQQDANGPISAPT